MSRVDKPRSDPTSGDDLAPLQAGFDPDDAAHVADPVGWGWFVTNTVGEPPQPVGWQSWAATLPLAALIHQPLDESRHGEHQVIGMARAHDLQPDRQASSGSPHGHADGRLTGHIERI